MKQEDRQTPKRGYAWMIVALCFLMVFTSMGLCSSGRSMYLTAVTDALGLSRSAYSLTTTIRFLTTMAVNLLFGTLVGKFGTKKLICAGFACLIGFALLSSIATGLVTFYLASVMLGVGLAWTGTTMASVVIRKWCSQNSTTITGVVMAANGIGGAAAAQILSPIIFDPENPFGYRVSYRLVALILAGMLVALLLFYKNPPTRDTPVTAGKKKIRGAGWVGMDYAQVVRKPYYYVSLVCMFLIGAVLQGLGGIAVPYMYDVGMDVEFVALVMSLSGIFLTGTKILTGFLYDRTGIKWTMNLALCSAFLAMLSLIFLNNTPFGRSLAMARMVFDRLAMPLETVMLPIFAVEFFGNKPFDKIIGTFGAASAAGLAVGAPFGNLCYDLFGDYRMAFAVFAVLMAAMTVTLQFVLRAANRDKQRILQALEEQV